MIKKKLQLKRKVISDMLWKFRCENNHFVTKIAYVLNIDLLVKSKIVQKSRVSFKIGLFATELNSNQGKLDRLNMQDHVRFQPWSQTAFTIPSVILGSFWCAWEI